MPASVFLQLAPHYAAEFIAATVTVFLIARVWKNSPDSPVVQITGHEQRFFIAFAFLVAPMLLGWGVFRPLLRMVGGAAEQVLWMGVSVLAGIFLGMAVSCVVAPSQPDGRFRSRAGWGIVAALVFMPICFFGMGGAFSPLLHLFVEAVVLFGAVWILRKSEIGSTRPPSLPDAGQRSPALALVLGFLPSSVVLLLISISSFIPAWGNDTTRTLFVIGCVSSLVCCLASSILLFKRRTGLAIFGGVLFLLLNLFIALLSGCAALLTGANFH